MIQKYINHTLKILVLLPLFFLANINNISATHIVGGDITYKYLGNSQYEISLTLRRDCGLGQVGYDDPVSIGIFGASNGLLLQDVRIPFMASDTVNNTIVSACGFEGSEVCVQRATYRDTIELPFLPGGYVAAYQRCCRNGSLNNVIQPLESGSTQWVAISEESLTLENSSPTFNQWPDIYICANEPLRFDHAASDIDGDSLVYKICTPFDGASFDNPRPRPPFGPTYNPVQWASPYDLNNMLGGVPLTIDSKTGLITATPNLVGQFLVGICVEEYRNGVLISTIRRDFQYNVRVCSVPVLANFDTAINPCDSLDITFNNTTVNGDSYEWNFNYPSTDPTFISTLESPNFKYTTAGTYQVRLTGKSSNGACDSIITKSIVVRPGADTPNLQFIAPSLALCPGETSPLLLNYDPNLTYVWTPTTGLTFDENGNVTFAGGSSTEYTLEVTNQNGCKATGTIAVVIKKVTDPLVISGPSNVCNNIAVLTIPQGSSSTAIEWSNQANFSTILSNTYELRDTFSNKSTTYYVRTVGAECGDVSSSVTVNNQRLALTYTDTLTVCKGETFSLSVLNNISDHEVTYLWSDPHVISGQDSSVIKITTLPEDGASFTIIGIATNQYGCAQQITIKVGIAALDPIQFLAPVVSLCAGESSPLLVNANSGYTYTYNPTAGLNIDNPSRPIFIGKTSTTYTVTATNEKGCSINGQISIVIKDGTTPIIISGAENICGNMASLTVAGGTSTSTYQWSNRADFGSILSTTATLNHVFEGLSQKYYVRTVGAECGDIKDSITVFDRSISLKHIDSTAICTGSQIDISVMNNIDNQTITYTWDDAHIISGQNGPTISITTLDSDTESFVIKGLATNQYGCTKIISILVKIITQEEVDFSAELRSCEDQTMCFNISGTFENNITWNFGTTQAGNISNEANPCFLYQFPGTYTVTLQSNSMGCPFATLTKEIIVPAVGVQKVEVTSNLTNCNLKEVCFDVKGNYVGGLLWNFNDPQSATNTSTSGIPCHNFSAPGTYNVTLANINPSCPFETVNYQVVIAPTLSLSPIEDLTLCEGESTTFTAESNDANAIYIWYNEAGESIKTGASITLSPMNDTKISVVATSQTGCTDTTSVQIKMFKFDYTIELPTLICANEDFQAKVLIANPENYTFVWTPVECLVSGGGTNLPIISAVPGKKLTVVITNKLTGCQETRELNPNVTNPLVYNISGDLCNNQASTLTLNIENPGNYTYVWSPNTAIVSGGNTNNPDVKVLPGQELTVVVTNSTTGCVSEIKYIPNVLATVDVIFNESNVEISQGTDTDISIKSPQVGITYQWSTGETGTSINVDPLATTTYTVTATNANGCTGVGQITVTVRVVGCTENDEYIPNAFTPNGDGMNDILYVRSNVITDLTFVIFNRWGEQMFSTTDINEGWDGMYKGQKLSPDAYAYYIKATCINGDNFIKKGNVSILK